MKLAVVGSRGLTADLSRLISPDVTEIISGGARGIDECAAQFARDRGLRLTEFRPDYPRYGRGAPLKRNVTIIEAADAVLAIWDGKSPGTRHSINLARTMGKSVKVVLQ